MKKLMNIFLSILIIVLILFIVINIIYFAWYIASPEGFWGFNYFWEVLRMLLILCIVFFVLIIFGVVFIDSIYKIIVGKGKIQDVFKIIGYFFLILFISLFNYGSSGGLNFYIANKLSDKYSYLEKTNSYLDEGDRIGALESAKSSYEKELNRKDISYYFFMAKLYSQTDFDKKQKLISKYASIINYAYCLQSNPKSIQKSKKIFKQGLKLTYSNLLADKKNNLAIFPILSLAEINLTEGNYKIAEDYFLILQKLASVSSEKDVIHIIEVKMLFADKALRVGDKDKAMNIFKENLILYEKSMDLEKNSSIYLALLILAINSDMYYQNFEKATELLLKAMPIAEKKKDKFVYSSYLTTRGNYCYLAALNNFNSEEILKNGWIKKIKEYFSKNKSVNEQLLLEAEDCFKVLLNDAKEKSGVSSDEYINCLNQLATYYKCTGKVSDSKKLYKEALQILKPNKTKYKDLYYGTLINYLSIDSKEQNNNVLLNEIVDYNYDKLKGNYLFLTEDEKVSYAFKMEKNFEFINGCYIQKGTADALIDLYNNVLAFKNIALYSNQNLRQYLSKSDSKIKENYFKILKEKENLIAQPNVSDERAERINQKQRDIIFEITNSPEYNLINPRSFTWKNLKDKLKADELAIEIINLPTLNKGKNDRQYFALLTSSDSNAPEIVNLFFESELGLILNVKGQTKERINSIYLTKKDKLLDLIWGKIEKTSDAKKTIFLSVSGILHTISFPVLMHDKKQNFIFLESTREVSDYNTNSLDKSNLVLFGGIDYGTKKQDNLKETTRSYDQLKFTENEIYVIEKNFNKIANNHTIIFSGKNASEENFKKLNGKKHDIVHIATHGFYDKYVATNDLLNNGNKNVLQKSGLVFSNANKKTTNTANDGLLNSFEISQMDLSNVDLLVLSACETGLGDIKGSEGVFGLRRAFKLAGVKSMIVSLWQVPDGSTSQLMASFYQYYLEGHTKRESLKMAQEVIKQKYNSPFYWGGFVLIE